MHLHDMTLDDLVVRSDHASGFKRSPYGRLTGTISGHALTVQCCLQHVGRGGVDGCTRFMQAGRQAD